MSTRITLPDGALLKTPVISPNRHRFGRSFQSFSLPSGLQAVNVIKTNRPVKKKKKKSLKFSYKLLPQHLSDLGQGCRVSAGQ